LTNVPVRKEPVQALAGNCFRDNEKIASQNPHSIAAAAAATSGATPAPAAPRAKTNGGFPPWSGEVFFLKASSGLGGEDQVLNLAGVLHLGCVLDDFDLSSEGNLQAMFLKHWAGVQQKAILELIIAPCLGHDLAPCFALKLDGHFHNLR
jgi:hypothetical protein